MKKIAMPLALVGIVFPTALFAQPPIPPPPIAIPGVNRPVNDYTRAVDAIAQRDFDGAIAYLDRYIQQNPAAPFAYSERSIALEQKGRIDDAIADVSRVLDLRPGDTVAHVNRAMLYISKRDFGMAMKDLNQQLEARPNDTLALATRADAWSKQGKLDQAIADYTTAMELAQSPSFVGSVPDYLWLRRAVVYYRAKRWKQAVDDCDFVLGKNDHQAYARYIRGLARVKLGSRTEGQRDITQASSQLPQVVQFAANDGLSN